MPGLVPGIHVLATQKTWMAGASPAMTPQLLQRRRHHCGGAATATRMVHTSLLRLTISRISLGPM
jgi:hypothetical protein